MRKSGQVLTRQYASVGVKPCSVINQSIRLIVAVSTHGKATAINVVYSARGLWSVLAVWWLGHWFGNTERERGAQVLRCRLVGALLLMAAIVLVILK